MEDVDLVRVFITMHGKPETTLFDWARHVEELRSAVGFAVRVADWDRLAIYGPGNEGFGSPAICISAVMTRDALQKMAADLDQTPWMTLPIAIFPYTPVVTRPGEAIEGADV